MAFDKANLDDYNTVAERIAEFKAKYPGGYLRPLSLEEPFRVVTIGERVFITVVAAAFRESGDEYPGIGMAWEPFPGQTNFTRNSELMNAETSAWGRAIIAVGAADARKGIASREEVRNRQDDAGDATQGSTWRPDPNPRSRKADRHNGPRSGPLPDDQWSTEPRDETTAGTSLPDQHRQISIALGKRGVADRDAKLAFCENVIGRPVTSSKELSYLEAAEVLRQAQARPGGDMSRKENGNAPSAGVRFR